MTERMDVVAPRKGSNDKTYYDRIGVAFPTRNGGWSVKVSAWPVGDTLLLFVPRPKDERQGQPDQDMNDSIPF